MINETIALITLSFSGFLSATLLPGSSELGFLWFLKNFPENWLIALVLVSLANTLGSLTSYLLGRLIPDTKKDNRAISALRKRGAFILFFSWVPLIGDSFPLAAGWLRIPIIQAIFWILIGKSARYLVLLMGFWAVI